MRWLAPCTPASGRAPAWAFPLAGCLRAAWPMQEPPSRGRRQRLAGSALRRACLRPASAVLVHPSTLRSNPEQRQQLEGTPPLSAGAHTLPPAPLFPHPRSNPEYRQQLEGMLQAQVAGSGSPAMQEMMAGMDMSPEKVRAHVGWLDDQCE